MKIFLPILFVFFLLQKMNAQTHTITIHANQRVVSFEVPPAEYDSIIKKGQLNFSSFAGELYQKFDDKFDFIFFVLNEPGIPPTITAAGTSGAVANEVTGIGTGNLYNRGVTFGSSGKLKSIITLSLKTAIMGGPSLHEILHTWANYGIPTKYWDGSKEIDYTGHWGLTGGTTPGQLGGFQQSTLQTNIGGNPNKYSVLSFGANANGGNGIPYNKLELYLMGMIPITDVPVFDAFSGISQLALVNNNVEFIASTRTIYDNAKLLSTLGGPRNPSYTSSQKNFRALIVIVTRVPLTTTEWSYFDDQSERFGRTSGEGTSLYNFWEATNGAGSLETGNLDKVPRGCGIAASANSVCERIPVTFTATVLTSIGSPTFQWTKNSATITGANSSTYTASDLKNYDTIRCIVNKGLASETVSNPILADIIPTPAIPTVTSSKPAGFCQGDSTVLTSSTGGGTYQWYLDDVTLTGGTLFKYSAKQAGKYSVKLTSAYNTLAGNTIFCSAISVVTTVVVNPLPSVPAVTAGGPLSFCSGGNVILTSSSATSNQWYKDGIAISGANSTTYSISVTGSYTDTVTNVSGCKAGSLPTTVTVNPFPSVPYISSSIATTFNINSGDVATFCDGRIDTLSSSSATGNQWYKNGIAITGATNKTYLANTAGSYSIIVTNTAGCKGISSFPTIITINALPPVPAVVAGSALSFCSGSNVVLTSSSATSNQWYKDGVIIAGAANATYVATTPGIYSDTVTNASGCKSGSLTKTVVIISVATPTITQNADTLISSAVSGNQWYLNGVAITGAVNQKHKILNTGTYTVKVTDANGCASAVSTNFPVVITAVNTITFNNAEWKIYPNPVEKGILFIQHSVSIIAENVTAQITTFDGRVVAEKSIGRISQWDISRLSNGIYYLRIIDKKATSIYQIIKQ